MLAVTLLLLDYTGTIHAYLVWCAKAQLFPALLSLNIAAVLGLALMTLLFGRVYCSVICPLGIFQDIISRIAGIVKKNRYSYRPPRKEFVIVRYSLLAVFVAAVALHIPVITKILEPYSAYGRMISQIVGPLYQLGNNALAHFAERVDSYAFYTVDIWLRSAPTLIIAILTFAVISVFAWKSGRGYCSGVCPAGALLGLLSKYSLMKPRVNKEKCVRCGLCAKNCKAGCIDASKIEIDYTRCVACFNCVGSCNKNAVSYTAAKTHYNKGASSMKAQSDTKEAAGSSGRRNFLAAAALLLAGFVTRAAARAGYNFDGGIAPIEDKKVPARNTPVIPPGAGNARHFRARCTGCQLCVTVCPNHVLRPSNKLSEFMQPVMSFERGYCRPECVKCSQVCPTGAIRPITTAEKSATQIGAAVWRSELCVVNRDNVPCDRCERACPAGAIMRIHISADDPSSPKIPMIDTNRCIGCGACEHLCPSRPYSAIFVDGVQTHRII
ncbi:MAG: 4Fe-4S binding protein [Chitinispirillales bacterium]|nr:4Fe-4S binding protein [Chitinispirillales bacterium]